MKEDKYEIREESVALCILWMGLFAREAKTVGNTHSYQLKHAVEKYYDHYIHNEEFKEAAIRLGFKECYKGEDFKNPYYKFRIKK